MNYQSGLHDNYSRGSAGDYLAGLLRRNTELSVVSAYFTIHAYRALQKKLDQIDHLRFLFGEPKFLGRLDKDLKAAREYSLSSNFTVPDLGLGERGNNVELNLVVDSDRDRQDLLAWFNDWWSSDERTEIGLGFRSAIAEFEAEETEHWSDRSSRSFA